MPVLGTLASGLLVFSIAPEAEGHGTDSVIAAIFRAPLAGAMFAAEVLFRSPEFEAEVIIPTAIASLVSYCVHGVYSGWQPLFTIPDLCSTNPLELGPYLLLALAMVLLAMHSVWPELVPHPASYAIVGMAGSFTAAAKTPFSTIVIVGEMTGGYDWLLPSLWVCALAFLLSDQTSIYSSQVESRSRSPAHLGSYVREVLTDARVEQFLDTLCAGPVLRLGDPRTTVIARMNEAGSSLLPVVDAQNRCLGVVNLEEVHMASLAPSLQPLILADDLMRSDIRPLVPQDRLDRALELFVENDLPALPIVDDLQRSQFLRLARRSDITSVYLRHVQGPGQPEAGRGQIAG